MSLIRNTNQSSPAKTSQASQMIVDLLKKINSSFSKKAINELAWESKFIRRSSSKLCGFDFLLSMLIAGLHPSHSSLEQISDIMTRVNHNLRIKAQSLMERINSPSAVCFLRKVQEKLLKELISQWAAEIPIDLFTSFSKVLLQDSTVLELNEKLQDHFKGSGGRASKACAKIDVIYDLKTRQFEKIVLTDQGEADQKLAHRIKEAITENTLIIRDLGYLRRDNLEAIIVGKAFFISRLRADIHVYLHKEDQKPLDLVEYLGKQCTGKNMLDVHLYITEAKIPVRLVVYRAPQEVADKRRREAYKTAKKQGRVLREKTVKLMSYTIFITNVPCETLKTEVIGTIYRIRWQIEILFKCWKSGIKINYLKGINPERIRCLIYSRLILALVINDVYKLVNSLCIQVLGREASMYKVFIWMNTENRLIKILKGRLEWWEKRFFLKIISKSMCQQARKRKTAFQNIREGINFEYSFT
jgi:hypothetical protein